MIRFKDLIGSSVEPPGNPAWLLPFRTLCMVKVCDKRFVRILLKIFLKISSRTIGRVLFTSHSHSIGFGMGYRRAYFQLVGVKPAFRHPLKSFKRYCLNCLLEYLTSS